MSVSVTERPGHRPTVLASFLYFDMSFTLWVLLGALGIYIAESLALRRCALNYPSTPWTWPAGTTPSQPRPTSSIRASTTGAPASTSGRSKDSRGRSVALLVDSLRRRAAHAIPASFTTSPMALARKHALGSI